MSVKDGLERVCIWLELRHSFYEMMFSSPEEEQMIKSSLKEKIQNLDPLGLYHEESQQEDATFAKRGVSIKEYVSIKGHSYQIVVQSIAEVWCLYSSLIK